MTRFAYETEVDVRWRDLDPLGHVNNAVYATYFELARLRYLRDEFGVDPEDPNFVVARLELDFLAPVSDVDSVTVRLGVDDVGETSFRLAYELATGETVAARGETVQVTVDEDGRPTPVPAPWRDRLEALVEDARRSVGADRVDGEDGVDGKDRVDGEDGVDEEDRIDEENRIDGEDGDADTAGRTGRQGPDEPRD